MNIFLDDDLQQRQTPIGFERFVDGTDLMTFMTDDDYLVPVAIISFDNDLGYDIEGYDVLKNLVNHGVSAKRWNLHSANVIAVRNMRSYLESAMKMGVIDNALITTTDCRGLNNEMRNL